MPCTHKYSIADLTDPKLEDLAIKTIRALLTSVTWVDYILPKAYRRKDAKGLEFPFCHTLSDRNEVLVSPDSALKGIIFFEVKDAIYGHNRGERSQYNISLYCWVNLPKITASKQDIRSNLMADILGRLFRSNKIDEKVNTTTNTDDVFDFSGFQQEEFHSKFIMGKYDGFRIDFTFWQDDCYATFTPTTPAGC